MLTTTVPLSRLQPLANNSKRHNTAGTLQSISEHGFRDPIQVDLALTETSLDLETAVNDKSFKLPIVAGHDRHNALTQRFTDHPDHPPEGIKVLKVSGKVTDWLVPVNIFKSDSYAMAIKYSVDHNLTTASVLGEDVIKDLFNAELLGEQAEIISDANPDSTFAGINISMHDLIESLGEIPGEEGDDFSEDEDSSLTNFTSEIPDDNREIDEEELAKTNHECPSCGYQW